MHGVRRTQHTKDDVDRKPLPISDLRHDSLATRILLVNYRDALSWPSSYPFFGLAVDELKTDLRPLRFMQQISDPRSCPLPRSY
jgi:hypothetical protein